VQTTNRGDYGNHEAAGRWDDQDNFTSSIGGTGSTVRRSGSISISSDKLEKELKELVSRLENMFESLRIMKPDGWTMDGIGVSLAVSIEGSIGIVTAGAEAGIELTFKPPA